MGRPYITATLYIKEVEANLGKIIYTQLKKYSLTWKQYPMCEINKFYVDTQ